MRVIANSDSGRILSQRLKHQMYLLGLLDKILLEARQRNLTLRVFGGAAVWIHCPGFRYLLHDGNRSFLDLDVAAYLKDVLEIQNLFDDLGFEQNKNIMRLFGTQRRIFYLQDQKAHVDLVFDRLHFSHDVNLLGRLELDNPTIPLVDLLLSKLQIVELTSRDILDIAALLLEHDLGNGNDEMIDSAYMFRLCATDWGLWKTVSSNLRKVNGLLSEYVADQRLRRGLAGKLALLENGIEDVAKSFSWRIRSLAGEKLRWYNEVEELQREGKP